MILSLENYCGSDPRRYPVTNSLPTVTGRCGSGRTAVNGPPLYRQRRNSTRRVPGKYLMRTWMFALLLLAGCDGVGTIELPHYEYTQNSGPPVILLATSIDDAMSGVALGSIPEHLISAGFSTLVFDLPCHGTDAEAGVQPLACWRNRLGRGELDMFDRFCEGVSAVMDQLHIPAADVIGLSRGGYVAVTCAASDTRIHNLALLQPVTDLQRLSEFDGYTVNESRYGLTRYASQLKDRRILVRIGERDDRVGTDAAVTFANAVHADLQLLDIDGHNVPLDDSAMNWLMR